MRAGGCLKYSCVGEGHQTDSTSSVHRQWKTTPRSPARTSRSRNLRPRLCSVLKTILISDLEPWPLSIDALQSGDRSFGGHCSSSRPRSKTALCRIDRLSPPAARRRVLPSRTFESRSLARALCSPPRGAARNHRRSSSPRLVSSRPATRKHIHMHATPLLLSSRLPAV